MLIILFGHLWVVEETCIYIFAFKFTFRCLLPDMYCSNYLPPVSITPVANLPLVSLILVAFATGVVDTGGKSAAGIVDTGGKFAPVSTTQGEMVAKFAAGFVDTGGKFATGIVVTGGAP
jgi:hypothetical protein